MSGYDDWLAKPYECPEFTDAEWRQYEKELEEDRIRREEKKTKLEVPSLRKLGLLKSEKVPF